MIRFHNSGFVPALALFAAFCVALLALTVALARSAGQHLPDRVPWVELGFAACDLPCWADVEPGQTAFEDVLPLLAGWLPSDRTSVLVSGSQVNFQTQSGGQVLRGLFFYNQGRVGDIRITVEQPIGQLMRRLGPPDCVWLERGQGNYLAVYWEEDGVSTGALFDFNASNVWGPTTSTRSLWMSASSRACTQAGALPWLGFAPWERYAASA